MKKIGINNESIYRQFCFGRIHQRKSNGLDNEIVNLSYKFMQEYNFLPNDALILATAKLNDISYLASFDENDFKISCKKEKIKLVKVLTDIK
jgi:predicted nucleic acid-binding protein